MNQTNDRHMLRWGLTALWLVSSAGVYSFYVHIVAEGWWFVSLKLRLLNVFLWVVIALLTVVCIYAWAGRTDRLLNWLERLVEMVAKLRLGLWPVLLALLAVFPLSMSGISGLYLDVIWTRQAVFIWLMVILAIGVAAMWQKSAPESALIAALSMSVVYHLATYIPHVTNYPFSLWWSETTRYYLASTALGQKIYGQELPWMMKDLTRYLIQAVPFLIEDSPLWLHRLWQVSLRFTTSYLAGYLLARRFNFSRKMELALFSVWAGLFLFQGPVFYHLIVVVMLIYWLADPHKFWKTLVVVVIASIYAGFSRVNWVPMAAILASVLYFLEVPVKGNGLKAVFGYLWMPAVWSAAGLASGLAAQQYWYVNSGNPVEIYQSSFTSYMLWDRLLPNPSYALGILPAIVLVSLPLLIYLAIGFKHQRRNVHSIRLIALGGILLVLFAGGLLISVKIGGGTNLHNLDMYLVVLLTIGTELYMGRAVTTDAKPIKVSSPFWLKFAAAAIPVLFIASFSGLSTNTTDLQTAYKDLAMLQKYVDQATTDGGEVLFISQRHLLAFDLIKDVPMVHEYEKMLLQEMVMGQNQAYLAEFAAQMNGQRFALIVTDPLPESLKDPQNVSLAMENNVVFTDLVPLITCAYQIEDSLVDGGVDIYIPRKSTTCGQE
ncbi:MAG: hypothetical protein JW757_05400 [Anaerolineales bacterium]|nr:hypothetical protein [Anaerolineales bacterium]